MIERLRAWFLRGLPSLGDVTNDTVRQQIANLSAQQQLAAARLHHHIVFVEALRQFSDGIIPTHSMATASGDTLRETLRAIIREGAGLSAQPPPISTLDDGWSEFEFVLLNRRLLRPCFEKLVRKTVLFAGQAYYNSWYLSRALRQLGWKADVLNWDTDPSTQIYYHGHDVKFSSAGPDELANHLEFLLRAIYAYDVFHFSNAHGLCFGFLLEHAIAERFGTHREIFLLKDLGKKIVYSNNGCRDGVSQTSFASWGEVPVCSICRWRNEPTVCSDARNLEWGRFRNAVADFQCLLGGNRADFNVAPTVHEVPEFYCLDTEFWRPDLEIPEQFKLPLLPPGGVRFYHGVGHRASRTDDEGITIKSTHIYRPVIEGLRQRGYVIEMVEPTDVPNRDVRFYQAQADVFLDMLTYGFVGATAREAMMLGKPVVAYLRPEWMDSVRREIPEYADELPIVRATPETIESVLIDLIEHRDKRHEIGRRSREFAVKWHSSEAAGRRFDEIYGRLLAGDPQLLDLAAR